MSVFIIYSFRIIYVSEHFYFNQNKVINFDWVVLATHLKIKAILDEVNCSSHLKQAYFIWTEPLFLTKY